VKKSWILYIVARVLVFALPLTLLLVLGFNAYYSTGIAAIIGLALSVLLLSRWRSALSEEIYNRVNKRESADTKAEDED
jgi:uncharacterized membrane protein YccC